MWRWGDKAVKWIIYRWAVVTFGDQLASLILELVKNIAAGKGVQIDPEAADLLLKSMYVDDLLGGGSWDQVQRFRGLQNDDGTFTGTLSQILSTVSLKT